MSFIGHRNYTGKVGVISNRSLSLPDSPQPSTNQAERRTPAWKEGVIELFLKVLCGPGVWLSGGACTCFWKALGSIPSNTHVHTHTHACALEGKQLCVSQRQKLPSNSTEQPLAFRILSHKQKACWSGHSTCGLI